MSCETAPDTRPLSKQPTVPLDPEQTPTFPSLGSAEVVLVFLTFLCDSLHQHVELIYKHFLFTVHHPGEAVLEHQSCVDRVSYTALQLLCCLIAHKSTELWDS